MMFGFLTVDLNYLVNRASRSFHVAKEQSNKSQLFVLLFFGVVTPAVVSRRPHHLRALTLGMLTTSGNAALSGRNQKRRLDGRIRQGYFAMR
jgi:hypothetical protein